MAAIIITVEDLKNFKTELLEDIKDIIGSKSQTSNKKWLKSIEVRELLKISPGTLQNLRVNGTLKYTKIGGIIFYDGENIEKMLSEQL